jgi:hypothetical protein
MFAQEDLLRRLITGEGPAYRSPEQDPDAPFRLWERAASCPEWGPEPLTVFSNLGELSERFRRLVCYPWPDKSMPLEWCVTLAGETPATAERTLLYCCLNSTLAHAAPTQKRPRPRKGCK